jgi:hypothetical protein
MRALDLLIVAALASDGRGAKRQAILWAAVYAEALAHVEPGTRSVTLRHPNGETILEATPGELHALLSAEIGTAQRAITMRVRPSPSPIW